MRSIREQRTVGGTRYRRLVPPVRHLCIAIAAVLSLSLLLVPQADASYELVSKFAEFDSMTAESVAVNEETGDVYQTVGTKNAVLRSTPEGHLIEMWGWGVASSGPDDTEQLDQNQLVTIDEATGGTFTLSFEGQTTAPIAFDAPASEKEGNGSVEAALDALPSIGGAGGSAIVRHNDGYNEGFAHKYEYVVTFEGGLGGSVSDSPLSVDASAVVPSTRAEVREIAGYERCRTAVDTCRTEGAGAGGVEGEGDGEFRGAESIAVDQATGDVYVLTQRARNTIQVFSEDGEFIGGFGENTPSGVGPEEIEKGFGNTKLAVNSAGVAYVVESGDKYGPRVMVFEPATPGDYRDYVYAGRSRDLFVGKYSKSAVLAIDGSGDFYLINNENKLYKFQPGNLTTPAWEQTVLPGSGLAVDRNTGDVFYLAQNTRTFHRIDGASGDEVEVFPAAPAESSVDGIAYNAKLALKSGAAPRPAGVLYADAPYNGETGKLPFAGIFARPPVFPPRVDGESVVKVGYSSASLQAAVDPQGYDTRFRFQYGEEDCSTHSCAEAPLGGGDLGSGQQDLTAGVAVSGLQPDTTYHYRVLVSNQFGTVEGPDRTFTTYPPLSAGLPDGRVYELVSPPLKYGGEVFSPQTSEDCHECTPGETGVASAMQSAPNGESVVYQGFPFAAAGQAVGYDEYLSTRTPTGWQTRDLSPTMEAPEGSYPGFSADLSTGVLLQPRTPALSSEAPAGYPNLYAEDDSGSLHPLVTSPPPSGGLELGFVGGSSDFSHLLFESSDALTEATAFAPAAEDGGESKGNLYEWVDGALRLVNVLPGNAVAHAGARLGSALDETAHGGGHATYPSAVSADGSRIYWTDVATNRLYVREGGEKTIEVPDAGAFVDASSDGSLVLLSDGHLYKLEGEDFVQLADLTGGRAGFQGILGAGADLGRIYFIDSEVLTGGEQNAHGAAAQAGQDNAYVYTAGEGSVRFIATLADADNNSSITAGDWVATLSRRTSQVTPDGRLLAFMSVERLTGYDNTNVLTGDSVYEVFEYDAESGNLICVSCGRTGTHPTGLSRLGLIKSNANSPIFPQPRELLPDGRVLFDSHDSLSPFDTNGDVQDVYEYEPDGVGSCLEAQGCDFLLSGGQGSSDSELLGASASGSDVFFTTRDRLVPEDQDQLQDLYDARVGGGFPVVTPPQCTGTGCQGVPNAPPIFATPSSVTFAGVGNFEQQPVASARKAKPKKKPAKCPKSKKRKHGRCASAKRTARKSASKHTAHGGGAGR